MKSALSRSAWFSLLCILFLFTPIIAAQQAASHPGGELKALDKHGQALAACPLERTEVHAVINGFISRVQVKQVFQNPYACKIEAVYLFPLPHDATVDGMVMTVNDRRVRSQIMKREEARQAYDQAKEKGQVTSLLDQERPNVYCQSVANIEPGARIIVEICYVETLQYEDGQYEFVFPMVVAPRYTPDDCPLKLIEPPVAPPDVRPGHGISLTIELDAGMPLFDIKSQLHEIAVTYGGIGQASITLAEREAIPNRDFILNYSLGSQEIEDAFLVHEDERGLFFTLLVQPPRQVQSTQVVPRELIFVLDTSGSMNGFPIEKAKETVSRALYAMGPRDSFNLITFAGSTRIYWDKPQPNTYDNLLQVTDYLESLRGNGGTEMMEAINAALVKKEDGPAIRIVCFMTDGKVGNDYAIIDAVKKNARTTRVFSFGTGNSVNRFLLDGMAHAGRGEVEYVTLEKDADDAVIRFYQRIQAPVLTDIEIGWGNLPVESISPMQIPDLFSAKPVLVHGRLREHGEAMITLRGNTGVGAYDQAIFINTIDCCRSREALPPLWAGARVKDLLHQDLFALQKNVFPDELKQSVIQLGLDYRLMTPFTSFVAVEERFSTMGGEPAKVLVPVANPEGTDYAHHEARISGSSGFLTGRGRQKFNSWRGGPTSPGPGGPRAASTGGLGRKRTSYGEGYERWEFWWENNKAPFLASLIKERGDVPGFGLDHPVIPLLQKALKVNNADIVDSALLALARIVRQKDAQTVLPDIVAKLKSQYPSVREAAPLALGVLGSTDALPILFALLTDDSAGQKLVNQQHVPPMVRAFAGLAVGMIDAPGSADRLINAYKKTVAGEKNIRVCIITALGLLKGEEARERVAAFLHLLLRDQQIDPLVHAAVPIALARIGHFESIESLLRTFQAEGVNPLLRQSCVLALGLLAGSHNQEVIDALINYTGSGQDVQTRHFALIALGQIGARDEEPEKSAKAHAQIRSLLLLTLVQPRRTSLQPWAALAGAIYGRSQDDFREDLIDTLNLVFKKSKNPSYLAAMAVSLGLLEATEKGPMLLDQLTKCKDKSHNGYVCLALGLMQYEPAVERMSRIAAKEVASYRLRLQAVTALGLLGHQEVQNVLIGALKNGETLSVSCAAAKAMGYLGEPSLVGPLMKLVEDSQANPLVRAFAVVSLGMLGEKTELPWNCSISVNTNYRAKVEAIAEVLDIM